MMIMKILVRNVILKLNVVLAGKVDPASCPTGWQSTLDDPRCFGLFFDRKNWQDSWRACQNLGGDLASFHTRYKLTVLVSNKVLP